MVKKNFLYILVSLFVISVLFTGCSTSNNTKVPVQQADTQQQIKVVSDTPAAKPVVATKSAVDTSFDTNTVSNTSDVEIGSLI